MNRKILVLGALCGLALVGCNGFGSGEGKFAQVDNETVYNTDIDFAVMTSATGRADYDNIVKGVLTRSAVVSKALQEYPELGKNWESYSKNMDDRLLTLVYQRFYSMEKLTYSDADLKAFFDAHKADFADSTGKVEFIDVRGKVADRLLLEREAEKLKESGGDTAAFIGGFKQEMVRNTIKTVKEKFPVTVEKIVPPDPQGYYEKHKEEFKTAPAFEVYHVQMEDSAALAKLFKKPVDLEKFKAIAAKKSANKETAANGGYVGVVKEGYALPYGIGIINGLAEAFTGKPEGTLSPVLGSTRTPGRHVFYLVREIPPEVKPYDRVKADVENHMLGAGYLELPPDYVLISKNGAPLVTEKQILQIFEEEPGMPKTNNMRERIIRSLAECASFADEARAIGLDSSWEYRALVRQTRDNYIISHYDEMAQAKNALPEDSLKAYFEKNGNPVRPRLSYEESKTDLVDYIRFPENVLKRDYYFNYVINAKRTMDETRKQVFSNRIGVLRKARKERIEAEIWANAKVKVFKEGVSVEQPAAGAAAMQATADSLYKARSYEAAVEQWKKVRDFYPDNDTLFAKATLQIAQIQSEAEQYSFSEAEYNVFYKMWPDSPDAEKAMFSRGFILNENLHKDTLALQVLEEFQAKYPNSEMGKDVNWLIENIKSGGKLAEDLMKKIESEE